MDIIDREGRSLYLSAHLDMGPQFHFKAWAADDCIWFAKNGNMTVSKYDRRSQICCDSSGIHNKSLRDGHPVDCCGDKTYDTRNKICCGNLSHDKYIQTGPDAGKPRVCCGNQFFVEDRLKYCCGDAYIPWRLKCCGRKSPYNNSASACVDDLVVPIKHHICNGQIFSLQKQKCCRTSNLKSLYNVSSWDRNFSCCGDKLFDKREKQCCRGPLTVQPRTGNCCGKGLYNPSTEICCQGNSIVSYGVLKCCGRGTVNASDPREHCCFAGKKAKSFRNDRQICCNGALHSITNTEKATCCGNRIYSAAKQVCCNSQTVINKTASHHSSCCTNGPGLYNSCEGQIHEKRLPMCGKLPYRIGRDLCCNGKVNKDAKTLRKRCCTPGTDSYHPDNETCCHSIVKEKSLGCHGNRTDSERNQLSKLSKILETPGRRGHGNANKPRRKRPHKPRRGHFDQSRSGICEICSSQWKPKHLMFSIYSKSTNICTQKAMKFVVNNVTEFNWKGAGFQWSWLNVTSKQNLYRLKDPAIRHNFTLLLPCGCPQLQRLVGLKILLLTNTEFNKREIFLGDSDLILPGKRELIRLVKNISTTCPNYIVQNIYKIIQKSSIG
ncbi:uncharacterized protein LOC125654168 isoform X2 [Ostrea edulis]|uniref:uncharacterized protein LOC125654168 isoform X2 n=1 Tax=Ostrea edulis TaxID=37623 RepID=UPI0024AEAC0D|nr:uncharacterized protein LOC125654168 isoform X2 [Ostrea edulis]